MRGETQDVRGFRRSPDNKPKAVSGVNMDSKETPTVDTMLTVLSDVYETYDYRSLEHQLRGNISD